MADRPAALDEEDNQDSRPDHSKDLLLHSNHPERKSQRKRRPDRKTFVAVILISGLALAILAVFILRDFPGWLTPSWATSVPIHENPKTFRRPSSDYVLAADWNVAAEPTMRRYKWTITDQEVNPDGVYRPMILINGQFPGPLIECNEGDRLVIEVDNQGVNSTSFHWHGLFQNGSNWMDGTIGVTQCPIAPGKQFIYDFKVDGQWGTYWYHSHHSGQTADGLFGPLIVHSAQEKEYQKIPYATDRVIMVHDHYHDLNSALVPEYLANDRENAEPYPDGAMINGMNVRDCSSLPHRHCDNSTAGLATINLAPNQNHRMRFINTAFFAEFQVQIDQHEFAVTEVDGTDVVPANRRRLLITPAQRYSIVLTANITSADSFWLRARMLDYCWAATVKNEHMLPEVRAEIKYKENAPTPTTPDWEDPIDVVCRDMNTTDLVPLPAITAPARADHVFYIQANFEIGDWRLSRGTFNSTSWRPNLRSPTLNRAVDGWQSGNATFRPTEDGINPKAFPGRDKMLIQVNGVQTIDLLIQNYNEGNHPMHLHGYKFFVMAHGHGSFDMSKYDELDCSNPLRRDTVSLVSYGWILIRIITDNPGVWAFHCHIAWHTEAGLLMQLLTRPEVAGTWTLPQTMQDLCEADGLEKGATIDDSVYYGIVPH